jgi:hypothetical protein
MMFGWEQLHRISLENKVGYVDEADQLRPLLIDLSRFFLSNMYDGHYKSSKGG